MKASDLYRILARMTDEERHALTVYVAGASDRPEWNYPALAVSRQNAGTLVIDWTSENKDWPPRGNA